MVRQIIVGIDEVGRGSLAGPLVAAAVILNDPIPGLKDSKLLSKKDRIFFSHLIKKEAIAFGIGWTDVNEINKNGLTFAVSNAMREALSKISVKYNKVIIDGNYNFLPEINNLEIIVKADQTISSVSAASIIAKVYRDDWMVKIAKEYPNYDFEKHVGYGTKRHIDLIEQFGPCVQHRMKFKPLLKYAI